MTISMPASSGQKSACSDCYASLEMNGGDDRKVSRQDRRSRASANDNRPYHSRMNRAVVRKRSGGLECN